MKYPRVIKSTKLVMLMFIGAVLLIGLTGCAPIIVEYDSVVGDPNAIRAETNILVRINESNLFIYFNKPETKQSIIDAVRSDLEKNLFYFGKEKLDVVVNIEKLSYRNEPWGLLWLPFVFIGAPSDKVIGEAKVALKIYTNNGTPISSYSAQKTLSKWVRLVLSDYVPSSQGGISKDALKSALEDIKSQIIADKDKINRAIQGIETVPEKEEPPPVTRSRPKVQAGATNIAVMDLDAFAISAPEALALTNRLRVELFNTGRFVVLERGKMQDILKEQGFQETGCTTTDCLVEVGQLLNMQHMVAGSVSKVGDVYSIEVRLIDIGTGEIMAAAVEDITGSLGDLLTRGIRNAALKLTR